MQNVGMATNQEQANEIRQISEDTSYLVRRLTRSGTSVGGRKKMWKPEKIKLNKYMVDMMSQLGERS